MTIWMVALSITARRPIGHVRSAPTTLHAPPLLSVAETKVRFSGRISLTLAVAGSGPAFLTVSVYATVAPALTDVRGVVLAMLRSARFTAITVTSLLLIVTSRGSVAG